MKRLLYITAVIFILAGCKASLPLATHPDKNTFGSGTIGSVKSGNNLYWQTKTFYYDDPGLLVPDSSERH